MARAEAEKLFRQEHIRPEDLLTDGPNNRLNPLLHVDETTVGNTKGKKETGKNTKILKVQRALVISNHEEVLRVFLPFISFGGAVLLFIQSLFAVAVALIPSLSR